MTFEYGKTFAILWVLYLSSSSTHVLFEWTVKTYGWISFRVNLIYAIIIHLLRFIVKSENFYENLSNFPHARIASNHKNLFLLVKTTSHLVAWARKSFLFASQNGIVWENKTIKLDCVFQINVKYSGILAQCHSPSVK